MPPRIVLETVPIYPNNPPPPAPTIGVNYAASGVVSVVTTLTGGGISPAFTPLAGRAFAISGDGTGTVRMTKLVPGDTVWRPTTAAGAQMNQFSGPFAEEWSTDVTGTQFRFEMIAAGTMNVRFDQ